MTDRLLATPRRLAKSMSGRKRLDGVSYERPVVFWFGATATTVAVIMQLPMFIMARPMHYRLAGMPVTTEMLGGMALMLVGLAATAYSVVPRSRPARPELSRSSIAPLDEARIKPAHVALLLVMALAVTIDGMKPAAFGFVTPGAEAEYGLRGPLDPTAHALPIGLYPLSGIVGTMLGSFLWGHLGDRIGRRASILLAAVLFIASSTCGAMPQYWMNLFCCFIMGLAAGGMLPIGFALLSETVPRRHRGWMMIIVGSNIVTAYILVSWLASTWASPSHFGWRLLWLVGLPTGVLLVGLNHWIPESPRFLLERGRDEEARAVMSRYGATLVAREPEAAVERNLRNGWKMLFNRPFFGLTAAIVLLALGIGSTQYGFQQWIPSNLERLGYTSVDASVLLRNAAVFGLPFAIPVALSYHLWGSKKTALCVTALIGAALAGDVLFGAHVAASRPALYVLLGVPVCGVNILNAVLAAYTAEVYPTVVRGRGSGLSAGATKAGGVLVLVLATAAFAAPSIRMSAAFGGIPVVLAVIALAVFGPETRHKKLEQITVEELDGRLPVPVYARTPGRPISAEND